jgi:hypothetical protein
MLVDFSLTERVISWSVENSLQKRITEPSPRKQLIHRAMQKKEAESTVASKELTRRWKLRNGWKKEGTKLSCRGEKYV